MSDRLIPYMRKSSGEDPELSYVRQRGFIDGWAAAHDVELLPEVWEARVSGSRQWRDRGLGLALAACERGEADGIVVDEQSRLSRENLLANMEVWQMLDRLQARLVCTQQGLDTETGDQELSFGLRALIERENWKNYARRMDSAKRHVVMARGVHIAGTIPVGYLRPERETPGAPAKPLVPDPAKAPGVLAAYEARAGGATIADVARLLDEQLPGGPSGENGAWTYQQTKRLLRNPVYLGEARQGKYVNPDGHEPIVSREIFDAGQVYNERQENHSPGGYGKHLLSGICRCGGCGYTMPRGRSNRTNYEYRCKRRHATGICVAPATITAAGIETLIEGLVLAKLEQRQLEVELVPVPVEVDLAPLYAELARKQKVRKLFSDPEYVAGLDDPDSARAALANVNAELAAIQRQIDDASHQDGPLAEVLRLGPIREVWATMPVDERRGVIAEMITTVIVSRGPRGTALADRIRIVWRGEPLPITLPTRGRPRRDKPNVEAGMPPA